MITLKTAKTCDSCSRPSLGRSCREKTNAGNDEKEIVMVRQTSLPLVPDWSSPKPHPTLLCPVWILSSIRVPLLQRFEKEEREKEKVLTTHPARLICRKPALNIVHLLGRKSEWRLPTRHTFPRQGGENFISYHVLCIYSQKSVRISHLHNS